MYINPKIGEKPFRLRGHVLFQIPRCLWNWRSKHFQVHPAHHPRTRKKPLTQELEDLKKEFERGCNAYNSMGILDNPGSSFRKEARELVDRGLSDIHGCVTVLKETEDSQLPVFIAQQAVEKFLKAFLVQSGKKNISEVKAYSHRILDAFEECAKVDKRLQSIRAHIDKLNLKDMSIRYAKTGQY